MEKKEMGFVWSDEPHFLLAKDRKMYWGYPCPLCLHVTADGGIAGHGFRGEVIVAVRSVQEGLPTLAVGCCAL